MKFKGDGSFRQLKLKDAEDEELTIDSYRGSANDGVDYQFVMMLGSHVFGLTRRQARKLAVALLKEEGK